MGDGKKRGQRKTCAVRNSYLSVCLSYILTDEGGRKREGTEKDERVNLPQLYCLPCTVILSVIIAIPLTAVKLISSTFFTRTPQLQCPI